MTQKYVFMQKRLIIITLLSFIILLTLGCAAAIKDYKPKTSTEEEIKTLLVKWETTWNKHDQQGNLALWQDRVKIMYGRNRKTAFKIIY